MDTGNTGAQRALESWSKNSEPAMMIPDEMLLPPHRLAYSRGGERFGNLRRIGVEWRRADVLNLAQDRNLSSSSPFSYNRRLQPVVSSH